MRTIALAGIAGFATLFTTGGDLPAASAQPLVIEMAQAGPWRHAREPRDRGMTCQALESEITEIDTWQAGQAPAGGRAGPSAVQGMRAGEVIARRTGNGQVSGIMRDAGRIFGSGNRQRQPQQRGPDGMAIADQRRAHLMSIYDTKNCWRSADGGYHDEVSEGPWMHPRQPRDRGMSCTALETEIGHVDTWLANAETRGITPGVDVDKGLDAAQSTARNMRDYETSGIIGDVRSIMSAGPRNSYEPQQDQILTDTAYMRRSHLMSLYESRTCWEQVN